MREFLENIGVLTKREIEDGRVRPDKAYYLAQDVEAFIEKATKHYCDVCDRWFEKTRGASAHKRFKHG